QPEGPRSVKSSPSAMEKLARATTSSGPNRLTRSRTAIRIRASLVLLLQLFGDRLDVLAELAVHRFVALLRDVVVVDVVDAGVEVGAHAARALDRHLRGGAGLAADAQLGRDREDAARHGHPLSGLGEHEQI